MFESTNLYIRNLNEPILIEMEASTTWIRKMFFVRLYMILNTCIINLADIN